jgi:predicted DNA-binding protein
MAATKVGKQIKIVSYYTPDAVEQLRKLSDATRVPQAAYLREALEDLLKKYAATLRKLK